MPPRSVKFCVGEYYHIYNRGHNRDRIFFERDNYLFFLKKAREFLLRQVEAESNEAKKTVRAANLEVSSCQIIAYCLMPNHYHFLVQIQAEGFSAAMQSFGQAYTNSINRKRDLVGPLFQSRFQAIHVDHEDYLLQLTRYIHLNPVVASIVAKPEDWEFSSYVDYLGLRSGSLPKPQMILRPFGSPERYRGFVEAGMHKPERAITHLMLD